MRDVKVDAKAIFLDALDCQGIEELQRYLEQVCGSDTALRSQVDELLRAHRDAGAFLGGAGNAETPGEQNRADSPGALIGPYKLLQPIGEGGMGIVWMAEQIQPVQRKVALKVIKPGMDSRQVIARFEAERQALALMDHVNIARVFDGGTTNSGRPFFVMELVQGVPITRYCDDNHLNPRQRLELFVPVCQAIQHAHQKGIIHRDLKPSNVLVAPFDGKPVVKVIDFGIAKATGQRLTEKTLFTGFGNVMGTLEYMSPEQAELNNQDIDTRSDIYSLGVLLYELLTGSTPLSHKQLKEASLAEILRWVKEEEPPRPSKRLSDSGAMLQSISSQRNMEPRQLTRLVRGELDWIVLKALEKDRNRRYETVNGFAADLHRYLNDEPVQACPPSAGYRLRKFACRHKVVLVTSGLVAAALLLGTAVSVWQAVEATAAHHLANEQFVLADERRMQAEAVADLLESVFKDLNPHAETKDGLTFKDQLIAKLDEVASPLEQEGADPLIQARLQHALGQAYRGLGEPEKAVPHLQRSLEAVKAALGPDHRNSLNAMRSLGAAYLDDQKLALALPLMNAALARQRALFGPDDRDTIRSMNCLGMAYLQTQGIIEYQGLFAQAVPLLEEALVKHKACFGVDHPETITSMSLLAGAYHRTDKGDLALPLYQEVLDKQRVKLGPDHPVTLQSEQHLASMCRVMGKHALARPLYKKNLALYKEKLEKLKARFGPDDPNTLRGMNELAHAYSAAFQISSALELYQLTLEKMTAKLGRNHKDTLDSRLGLAAMYNLSGKRDLALALFEETVEKNKAELGPDHPDTLESMSLLAARYRGAGKPEAALALYQHVLDKRKTILGHDDPRTLKSMVDVVSVKAPQVVVLYEAMLSGSKNVSVVHQAYLLLAGCQNAGHLNAALPLLEQIFETRKRKDGLSHPNTLDILCGLAIGYLRAGKSEQGLSYVKLLLAELRTSNHPNAIDLMRSALGALRDAGRPELSLSLLEHLIQEERAKAGDGQKNALRSLLYSLATEYEKMGEYAKETDVLRECWSMYAPPIPIGVLQRMGLNLIRQKQYAEAEERLREGLGQLPPASAGWSIANIRSMLGEALLVQKKYGEAEPLLLSAFDSMKEHVARRASAEQLVQLSAVAERLVQLYQALGQEDKANEWRQKLQAHREAEKQTPKEKER